MSKNMVGAISTIIVVALLVLGVMITTEAHSSKEITPAEYDTLKTRVSNHCPDLKPIVALYIEEYKFVSKAKNKSFLRECDAIENTYKKKEILQEFSSNG